MGKFDFSGWATKNNLRCSDGRTIIKDAFKDNDGQTVPLVWNHQHNDSMNVLGHALLENRDEGVYAYCTFNETESGQNAKLLVEHGDICALSIFANQLKQQGGNVIHGAIREVSLVLAGANPGAFIDSVISHGEESGEEAIIYTGEDISLEHADYVPKKEEKPEEEKTDEKTEPEESEKEKESKESEDEKTVQDIIDSMTEEQKNVMYAIVGQAIEDTKKLNTEDNEGGNETMKHNVFENEKENENENALSHDAIRTIIKDGKRLGSLRESFLAHSEEYGITNIDWLFPEAKTINNSPEFVKRTPDAWVDVVMNGVHHTPFSRIKSMFADITADEARAKGYTKGGRKVEEVFGLIKRTTEPTTIYKKQKLDHDDIVDITDFDVVAWLKTEMRGMLDEEIARAIVFGDKRTTLSPDKIDETKIRPICSDDNFYTIKKTVTVGENEEIGHAIIKTAVRAQDEYQGSGNLTFFTAPATVTEMLLLEDKQGHRLYKDVNELALALNVNKIVKVPASVIPDGLYGVIVDLKDYNVGADKGGSVNMFDDFDIDYNQQKYLIETRCSGALTKPYSAIALKVAQ